MTTFIGRLQQIGIGKESAAGTPVAPTFWLPKNSGQLVADPTTMEDDAGYGGIEKTREISVTKNMTKVDLNFVPRAKFFGNILNALYGQSWPTVKIPIPGSVTGTFVVGETVTESTSSAVGVIRRDDSTDGSAKALYLSVTSGTFTGGQTLTGGTSGATATGGTIESPSALRHHIFRTLQTNNHPAYTLASYDPDTQERASYCLLDTLDVEIVAGDYIRCTSSWKGKKITSTSGLTPSYPEEDAFLAKHCTVKLATAFTGLTAASAISLRRIKLSFKKNVLDYQGVGSDDLDSLHNGEFEVSGDMDLKYDAVTYRDYVINGSKRAMRVTIANTDATTIGSGTKPTLQFDFAMLGFTEFDRTAENGQISEQTIGFKPQYSATRGNYHEALLINSQITGYNA